MITTAATTTSPHEWSTNYTLARLDYVCDILGAKGVANGEHFSPTLLYALNRLGIKLDDLLENPFNFLGDQKTDFDNQGTTLIFNAETITVLSEDSMWIRRLTDCFKAGDMVGV